jgi:hypothetical protein
VSVPKSVIGLSVALALLVFGVSIVGILTPDFYHQETRNWQVQSVGQDLVDLVLVVPALLFTTGLMAKSKRIGLSLWGGILLYLIYTFTIYSFDVHFNILFYLYCIALGLSFYLFLYFLYGQVTHVSQVQVKRRLRKIIGIYFLATSVLFYFLWLSEVIPYSLANETPASLKEVGLPTNPVHVLDLAIILPAIFLSGILLLKNKKIGHIMTPVILAFFILMDLTIGTLSYLVMKKGFEGSIVLTSIMVVLALVSAILLYMCQRNLEAATYSH